MTTITDTCKGCGAQWQYTVFDSKALTPEELWVASEFFAVVCDEDCADLVNVDPNHKQVLKPTPLGANYKVTREITFETCPGREL